MLAELLKNVLPYYPVLEPHKIPKKSSKFQWAFINELSYSSESLWRVQIKSHYSHSSSHI